MTRTPHKGPALDGLYEIPEKGAKIGGRGGGGRGKVGKGGRGEEVKGWIAPASAGRVLPGRPGGPASPLGETVGGVRFCRRAD